MGIKSLLVTHVIIQRTNQKHFLSKLNFACPCTTKVQKAKMSVSSSFIKILFNCYPYPFAVTCKFRRVHTLNGSYTIAEIAGNSGKQSVFKYIRSFR